MEFMNMKKTLLLAGVACLISFGAAAKEYNPYIGLDYAYSKFDLKKQLKRVDDGYNSGVVNAGIRVGQYAGLEAFFQQAGDRKTHDADGSVKSKFYAYGADLMGYLPIPACNEKFNLLGSVGLGNYKFSAKYSGNNKPKYNKDRTGYRFGVGAQYHMTQNWSARVMGRYTFLGARDIDNLAEVTAGLRYTF